MSSILDHVEQAVPRATVYGAMRGSPVFIGKYYREVNPASNATTYDYSSGQRRINFVLASPDKTIFNDMRSCYLRYNIESVDSNGGNATTKISEPGSNFIERIVIKMNGTVVEDISRFDHLTSFFKRRLLTREQKNAREREGYDYIAKITARGEQEFGANGADTFTIVETNITGTDNLCVKLDLSGIMNVQQLLSGYYSPLEIDLYLQDPQVCCSSRSGKVNNNTAQNYKIKAPRLCIEQVVMSPEYVSAFEAALLANSSAQGIQIPFTTYYSYVQRIKDPVTYWIRRPVRYLKAVYWGAIQTGKNNDANYDSYRFCRIGSDRTSIAAGNDGASATGAQNQPDSAIVIPDWQISVGTKNYRKIDDNPAAKTPATMAAAAAPINFNESEVFFAKAVGHYNDYSTESDEMTSIQRGMNCACQGIDLEFSPDNDVLASETTLNSNDVRLKLGISTVVASSDEFDVFTFLQYQASIALFPGNETRLLVT